MRWWLLLIFIFTVAQAGCFSNGQPANDGPGVVIPGNAATGSTPPPREVYRLVPILMYHEIGDNPVSVYPELYVSRDDFRWQMEYLKEHGYNPVSLEQVFRHWSENAPLPPKPVVITFDDGYESWFVKVFPIMRSLGFTGTLFLQVDRLNSKGGLTDQMVREMIQAGFEIGSHTFSHPDLSHLSGEKLVREVAGSKRALEEKFGVSVRFFAYPGGRFNHQVVQVVEEAGYAGAVTVRYGWGRYSDSYVLKRIRISRSDGRYGFMAKLQTG